MLQQLQILEPTTSYNIVDPIKPKQTEPKQTEKYTWTPKLKPITDTEEERSVDLAVTDHFMLKKKKLQKCQTPHYPHPHHFTRWKRNKINAHMQVKPTSST